MQTIKQAAALIFIPLIISSCYKEDFDWLTPPVLQPISFNYTMPAYGFGGVPTKKLKIKVLDDYTKLGVKDAVYYVKSVGRKVNCIGGAVCDSLLYEDSVITDTNGTALITNRGNTEKLRPIKGYWQLTQPGQLYFLVGYDSTVIKLWPEVWVKIQVKNTTRHDSGYLFSPRFECTDLQTAYQPVITVNKDTTIVQRLWANQEYRISLKLLKGSFGAILPGEVILKEYNQFIGQDTTELILNY